MSERTYITITVGRRPGAHPLSPGTEQHTLVLKPGQPLMGPLKSVLDLCRAGDYEQALGWPPGALMGCESQTLSEVGESHPVCVSRSHLCQSIEACRHAKRCLFS